MEIKFRAWDREDNKMYDSNSIAVAPNNGRFSEWCISGDGITIRVDSNRFILMQYTGLKDKHNKEIYEGDIIRHLVTSTPKDMYENKCVIYDAASFKYECHDGTVSFLEWPASACLEIIGNIHENPELLEAERA